MITIPIDHTIRVRGQWALRIRGDWMPAVLDFDDPPDVELRCGHAGPDEIDWPAAVLIMSLAWNIPEREAERRMRDECQSEAETVRICGQCNGSGEGMYDGSICSGCRGSGEERIWEDDAA